MATVQLVAIARPVFAQVPPSGPPSTAPAPAGDVIHLKSGGQIRGTIVDVIPGSHARIQLATGEIATVPWSDIARVESARSPSTPAPPPPPPPVAPTAPEARRLVHIEAPRQVALERQSSNPRVWIEVCSSPCDKYVSASGSYRIAGSGVRASRPFMLDAGTEERVVIDVDPGSKGWFVGGIVITSIGGGATIIGLLLALVGSATKDLSGSHDSSLETAGLTCAAIGALSTVAGLIALTSNSSSTATLSSVAPAPGGADGSTRAPTWHASTPTGAPKPFALPIFSATF